MNVIRLAWYLFKLQRYADGDFFIRWQFDLNKWVIGYEGDYVNNFITGKSLSEVLDYFIKRKIKK